MTKKGKSRKFNSRKRMLQHQARHPHNDCPLYDEHQYEGTDPDMGV